MLQIKAALSVCRLARRFASRLALSQQRYLVTPPARRLSLLSGAQHAQHLVLEQRHLIRVELG